MHWECGIVDANYHTGNGQTARSYTAQGLDSISVETTMEKNVKRTDMYGRIILLYSGNEHNIVNQLTSIK